MLLMLLLLLTRVVVVGDVVVVLAQRRGRERVPDGGDRGHAATPSFYAPSSGAKRPPSDGRASGERRVLRKRA